MVRLEPSVYTVGLENDDTLIVLDGSGTRRAERKVLASEKTAAMTASHCLDQFAIERIERFDVTDLIEPVRRDVFCAGVKSVRFESVNSSAVAYDLGSHGTANTKMGQVSAMLLQKMIKQLNEDIAAGDQRLLDTSHMVP